MTQQTPENVATSVRQTFEAASKPPTRRLTKSSPRITLRLSEEEHATLTTLSQGMAVSAFIRESVFGADTSRRKRRSHKPVKDQAAMSQVLGLLGKTKIANNLNQLAHHANTGSLLIDDETLRQIDEAYVHVIEMRDALVRALGLLDAG